MCGEAVADCLVHHARPIYSTASYILHFLEIPSVSSGYAEGGKKVGRRAAVASEFECPSAPSAFKPAMPSCKNAPLMMLAVIEVIV